MCKKSRSGSGMNIPNHISESLETVFLFKNTGSGIFFTRDPGWKKFKSGIRDKHPGSATVVLVFMDKFPGHIKHLPVNLNVI
jgi:hypothetical protein